ncbi:zinc ribbon domain-containing protein [Actinophytocola gossypii]|uniref:Transposase n=1 Tax=Actinophytocola gossypii TaxID=2812003 RepID=A0ABT2JAG7_9PSEU|nr:zinc ribbon domain-containing protein [Actinophytocola gossypii]MCT2584842.1 transposase [Actinophytocola gossypii]
MIDVLVRYRYRIEPTGPQRAVLARTFGCVRVVFNDAGWGRFVSILEEKAEHYGRTVVKVDRWFPSSKTCSECGLVADSMPLRIRKWTCGCGAVHDRDFNAAINILAAGRAERINACGARVSPPSEGALGEEAGSRGKPRGTTTPAE